MSDVMKLAEDRQSELQAKITDCERQIAECRTEIDSLAEFIAAGSALMSGRPISRPRDVVEGEPEPVRDVPIVDIAAVVAESEAEAQSAADAEGETQAGDDTDSKAEDVESLEAEAEFEGDDEAPESKTIDPGEDVFQRIARQTSTAAPNFASAGRDDDNEADFDNMPELGTLRAMTGAKSS